MKILFVLDVYFPHIGGLEILFENIITRLTQKGNQVIVLTSRYSKNLPKYEKINNNLEIYRVGHNIYDFMLYSVINGVKLAKQCDIIHTTTFTSAIPASIVSYISGKKVVLTVHEIFGKLWYKFMGWKGFFLKIYESLIFKFRFDKLICVSNYTKNQLRVCFGIDDKKLITIYNGVDYNIWNKDNFNPDDVNKLREELGLQNNYVGVFFGRPGISKGLEYYIKAIPEIVKSIPEFKAVLLVSTDDKSRNSYIDNLLKELNISEYIIKLPSVKYNKLGYYISLGDFVVVPSLAEGFGFAAAETCALEKQLVVTNIGSLTEVVSGNINFVEPSNFEDIAQKVIDFKNGIYEKVDRKNFFWSDNIVKTLKVYESLINK